jgi:hypothetical protein
VADWHWEWHAEPDYGDIYRGAAGMECPFCGVVVIHAGGSIPLGACPQGSRVRRAKRDITKAANWSWANNGMTLKDYLASTAGQPYASYWTPVEVQQADQQAGAQP